MLFSKKVNTFIRNFRREFACGDFLNRFRVNFHFNFVSYFVSSLSVKRDFLPSKRKFYYHGESRKTRMVRLKTKKTALQAVFLFGGEGEI